MEAGIRGMVWEAWREACRHLEVEQSAGVIGRMLGERVPIDRLELIALEVGTGVMVRKGFPIGSDGDGYSGEERVLGQWERDLFVAWAAKGAAEELGAGRGAFERLMVGECGPGRWLAAPLTCGPRMVGLLLVRACEGESFSARHLRMVEAISEPLGALLVNDLRLKEMERLRAAAEADKRSALTRLGRQELAGVVVGHTGGLKGVMERVGLVSRSDVPVLLLGETGTGKEVIARAIHEQSLRVQGPFIRVNCGAIPPELIDSELFGHERGAFTGAAASRRGWFERADQGTLLLDEIGDLPSAAQVRLLRVLQEGVFERVGSERSKRVSVRIIAATHRDLPAMIQQGLFREDLWYRIASFPIVLPPLRERRQDIAELARHFAERAAVRFGLRRCLPSDRDLGLLEGYAWPGNIRELASVIDRAAILGDGHGLEIAKALGANGGRTGVDGGASLGGASVEGERSETGGFPTLDDAMRGHIESALRRTHGRIEGDLGAAKLLDINPHTLRARMRRLGVDWNRFRRIELEH